MPFANATFQKQWSPDVPHQGTPLRPAQQICSADGAIVVIDGEAIITKSSAAALTLAAPPVTMDGARLSIVSTTAYAHTVTQTTPGFNGGSTASDVATFSAVIGATLELTAYQGVWLVNNARNVSIETGTALQFTGAAFASDGAITLLSGGIARLTKAGVGVYTLAAPALDNVMLIITSTTANAHTVTYATGFNAGGSSLDVATFGGAIGDTMTLIAVAGTWYTSVLRNVTLG